MTPVDTRDVPCTMDDYRYAAHFAKTLIEPDNIDAQTGYECYMCFFKAKDFGTLAEHVQMCHVPKSQRVSQDTERFLNNESTETEQDERPPSNSRNGRGL